MVLEDVTELYGQQRTGLTVEAMLTISISDFTGAQTKLPKVLLNGNNICMVCTALTPLLAMINHLN